MRSTAATYRLEGKVAIITGEDEGISRAIALRLAAEGAEIDLQKLAVDGGRAAV